MKVCFLASRENIPRPQSQILSLPYRQKRQAREISISGFSRSAQFLQYILLSQFKNGNARINRA
jgi:hypothetical protein